jgi:hypothetical protein
LVRYEGGYTVDTMFNGSKMGIEPHTVKVTPAGELLVLDSINNNMYRVQLPLSRCEQPLLPTTLCAFSLLGRHRRILLSICHDVRLVRFYVER